MSDYKIRALTPDTWDAYAAMLERHNGVFGGCWCTWFHTMSGEKEFSYDGNRALKQRLVDEDRAHAALVFDGDEAVAWAQFGSDLALQGAVDLIAAAGGGTVEGYPHDKGGKREAVLYSGTRALFERAGFEHIRSKGQFNCVMRRTFS